MTTEQITELRRLLAEISEQLKDAKTHVRGISAYRADHDGLVYATSKLNAATFALRQVAEDLNTLAGDLTPISTAAITANADNGREIEALA